MAIGERIRYFRNKRGMTQKYLGTAVGFPFKLFYETHAVDFRFGIVFFGSRAVVSAHRRYIRRRV